MAEQEQEPRVSTQDPGAAAIRKAGNPDATLTAGEELSAIDYLLGAPAPPQYTVEVQYETDAGMAPLTFHFTGLDGRQIDKIEQSNINERTGMMDKPSADAELVIAACSKLTDPTNKALAITSEQFRTVTPDKPPLASTVDALHARFGRQAGLIAGVAGAIREVAGWKADRVGKANRALVDAAGN